MEASVWTVMGNSSGGLRDWAAEARGGVYPMAGDPPSWVAVRGQQRGLETHAVRHLHVAAGLRPEERGVGKLGVKLVGDVLDRQSQVVRQAGALEKPGAAGGGVDRERRQRRADRRGRFVGVEVGVGGRVVADPVLHPEATA